MTNVFIQVFHVKGRSEHMQQSKNLETVVLKITTAEYKNIKSVL